LNSIGFNEVYAAILSCFDTDIIVQIKQEGRTNSKQIRQERNFGRKSFINYQLPAMHKALIFHKPEYYPKIVLKLECNEVLDIYKAIPANVKVALVI